MGNKKVGMECGLGHIVSHTKESFHLSDNAEIVDNT